MATIQNLVGTNKIKDEWQKINDNFAALNGDISGIKTNLGGWRIYNDVTELGLTPGTETMEQIAAAMTNRSMLIYPKDGSNTSLAYPSAFGMLIVTKFSNARVVFEFFAQSGGRPQKWIGYYASSLSPSFTGWSQDALEYETGTWTPIITSTSGSNDHTYGSQSGRYVRMGNLVFVWGNVSLTAKDPGMAGNLFFGGLPFLVANDGHYPAANIGYYRNVALGNSNQLTARFDQNSTVVSFWENGDNLGAVALNASKITDTTQFAIGGVYKTND